MFIGHDAVGFASKRVAYAGAAQGTAPPSVNAIIVMGFAGYLIPLWGSWIDRHREARG
jgi:hypothetical protein